MIAMHSFCSSPIMACTEDGLQRCCATTFRRCNCTHTCTLTRQLLIRLHTDVRLWHARSVSRVTDDHTGPVPQAFDTSPRAHFLCCSLLLATGTAVVTINVRQVPQLPQPAARKQCPSLHRARCQTCHTQRHCHRFLEILTFNHVAHNSVDMIAASFSDGRRALCMTASVWAPRMAHCNMPREKKADFLVILP